MSATIPDSSFRARLTEMGIRMLQIGDEDQPVIHPKVRDEVHHQHLGKRAFVRPESESGEVEQDAEIGGEDLPLVLRLEDDRIGVEVCISATRCNNPFRRKTHGLSP